MPTIPQQQTIVQYVANSSQTQYTFAFYAFNQANINVYYQAPNAIPVPSSDILALGSQYTVTFNADPTTGGFITLLFTPTTGYYLTIALNLIPSLNTNFANAQNFNGANLDAALDYLLMLCQQNLNYALQRNLSYVINTYLPNAVPFTQLPPLGLNQVWIGGSAGVTAAVLAPSPSASVLQSLLASPLQGADGASLIGYYDETAGGSTTVAFFLNNIIPFMQTFLGQQLFQPGMIMDYGGGTLPQGWLLCDGTAYSRTTYANLFAAIGTTWGVGDGSTTFNVPNFQRRVSVGSGGVGTVTLPNTLGANGGEEAHTMLIGELAAHNHHPTNGESFMTFSGSSNQFQSGTGMAFDTINVTQNTGNSTPFNIIQPSLVVNKMIKT